MNKTENAAPLGCLIAIISAIFDWCRHLFSPLSLVRDCIGAGRHKELSDLLAKYWLVPVLLIVGTEGAVLRSFGIRLDSEPILILVYLTFASLKFVAEAYILYIILWATGARVTPRIVFACFSVAITYAPLFSWIGIPQTLTSYGTLLLIKEQHFGFSDSVKYLFEISEKTTVATV